MNILSFHTELTFTVPSRPSHCTYPHTATTPTLYVPSHCTTLCFIKSLSALGDVIAARVGDASHVPFRNSTLTYLLKDSLSADSKTLMFVQTAPGAKVRRGVNMIVPLSFVLKGGGVENIPHPFLHLSTSTNTRPCFSFTPLINLFPLTSEKDVSESTCSLNFASRVRNVVLGKATRHVERERKEG